VADRTLIWFFPDAPHQRQQPTYFAEEDFEKSAVRIIADEAPVSDCVIDIFVADYTGTGKVSIFNNRVASMLDGSTVARFPSDTTVNLPKGRKIDIAAENFTQEDITEGQCITCQMVTNGGAKNITVILELNRVAEQGQPSVI
jgi:hypothetical protein